MSEHKQEACRGEATMRMVIGVFLFLDFAFGGFLIAKLFLDT
ncbi:MAG TPA: hypothetical protein VIS99_05395 [Terrimicrobiaceae bacterium]